MGLIVSLVLSQLTFAQPPQITSSMPALQLTGAPMIVDLQIRNPSPAEMQLPSLAAHPDLVRFELKYQGRRERRYNTAATDGPAQQWILQPGDERELRLEIPASAGLEAGPYSVLVQLEHDKLPRAQAVHTLSRQSPQPINGDLSGIHASPGSRHQDVAWVHQAGSSHHLVLHHQQAGRTYELVLSELSGPHQVWLSHSRLDSLGERSILWKDGPQTIQVLRLRGQRVRGSIQAHDLPWPEVEIAGQPITDHSGILRVPIWIPAPAGPGGELRLASFIDSTGPSTQRIARLDRRPSQVLSTLNAAGAGCYILVRPEAVDVYTAQDGDTLPLSMRPLWRPQTDARALRVAMGTLSPLERHPGGTALLLAARWPDGIATQWLSLTGSPLQAPALTADLGTLTQLIPMDQDWPALVFTDDGATQILVGAQTQEAPATGTLGSTKEGTLVWRTLTQDGPVNDRPVILSE